MANESNTNKERSTGRGLRLSLPMRDMLTSMIRAIDLRRLMINAAAQQEYEYHPETCNVCEGAGFLMVPNAPPPSDSEDESDVEVNAEEDDDVKVEDDGGIISSLVTHGALPALPSAQTSGASASILPGSAGAAPPAAAATVPNIAALTISPTPATSAPAIVTGTNATAVPAPIAIPVVGAVPPAAQAAAPVAPNVPTSAVAALTGVVTAAAGLGPYPISTVIPGFHSLGPNSATPQTPPQPLNAVFTGYGEERYYAITKGVRVGIYGGWQNTSPYVTGVASASFSRHRSLEAAFQAYEVAFNRGIVAYV
ncbi:hypothetical protein D9611_006754 [Ephemerocybe angulata]|uniref:Ribonuclease H1 N-terminal domain-containing protein n=1 Tax=Ephemerocybe angulata TaxID=980116 RepID=A0A8H5AQP3_9AGAR|nr:hypothetical protein D9611_015007 [Tulosesus angulatus]KAF5336336.1 hypothetical protein D9611_006754 [Tulosesus angulatus]